jgi:hypothetical protein
VAPRHGGDATAPRAAPPRRPNARRSRR